MPTGIETLTTFERGWIFRHRPARIFPPARVILLIHGWTGNEMSMEIFGRELPDDSLLFYPRGPVSSPESGYGWIDAPQVSKDTMEDFSGPANNLMAEVDYRLQDLGLPQIPLSLVGFSQGAALAYTLLFLYPERINRMAALAGYLPILASGIQSPDFKDKPVFIAHGTRDETIPVEMARSAVDFFRNAEAEVTYCESNTSHKLALPCFQDLRDFLSAR